MPGCSKQKNPKGIEITFIEDSHKYFSIIDGQEIDYTSGTTFVNSFFPKFDPTGEMTQRVALREGVSPEVITRRWKEKGRKSSEFGTKIHETIEDVLRGNVLRNKPNDEKERNTMKKAVILGKKLLERLEIIGIEQIVFDSDIRIAGTMDLFGRSKKDGKLWILDHKTNESIDTFNKYNKFALRPIQHVADTNYFHYTLQLNLYENILKRAEYVPKDESIEKALLHITESAVKTYQLPQAQKEIEAMIQHFTTGGTH